MCFQSCYVSAALMRMATGEPRMPLHPDSLGRRHNDMMIKVPALA